MLVPGRIGFSQKRQRVVDAGQLRGLANLSLIRFLGAFDDCLPYIPGEGLVGICRNGQFAVYQFFCDFFVSV